MSYEGMKFVDHTVSIIKDFVDELFSTERDLLLGILIKTLKELRGGFDTHS